MCEHQWVIERIIYGLEYDTIHYRCSKCLELKEEVNHKIEL